MQTLADVVTRSRRSSDLALRVDGDRPHEYDYHRLLTTTWKTGNFLRTIGVHQGVTVGIADDPQPQVVLSFFGAALLGAIVQFDPPVDVSARAIISSDVTASHPPPGGQLIQYGDPPSDPTVHHFERDIWSENPGFPPTDVARNDPVLTDSERTVTHGDLLDAARTVADDFEFTATDTVAVRAPLANPRTVAAGIIAPLLSGAAIVFPDDDTVGTVAVGPETAPEPNVVSLDDVPLGYS